MYAVIETGGKQYRVEVGTELEVEHLDVEPGDAITLDRVLLVADSGEASIGRPLVAEAVVRAEVVRQDRGEKLISFKYRPKARSRVKKGHRQELTVLRVTDVRLGERSAAEEVQAADEAARSERERLEQAAVRQAAADAELAAKLASSRPAEAPTSKTVRRRGAVSAVGVDAAAEIDAAAGDRVEAPAKAPKGRRKAAAPDETTDSKARGGKADAGSAPKRRAKGPKTTREDA
jgi:large subunit ribosomal protein L21